MTHLRWRGLALIGWLMLSVLLTPQLPAEYLVLHTTVLFLALVLPSDRIAAPLLLAWVFGANMLIYAVARWAGVPMGEPVQHLAQLAVISASALLARLVRSTISELDRGIWQLVLDGGLSRVRTWEEMHAQSLREIYRSRRYGRPLSLVMIDVERPPQEKAKGQSPAPASVFTGYEASIRVAQLAVETLRHLDLVAWSYKPRRLVVVLTEANYDAAQQFVARFTALVAQETGLTIRTGIATFPEHALTLDDLYQRAEAAIEQRVTNEEIRIPTLAAREQGS